MAPCADQRASESFGEFWEKQGEAEDQEDEHGDEAAALIQADDPMTAVRRGGGDQGKCECHAEEQREAGAAEGAVGVGKDERQHGENARAEDRQDAADKC